MELNDWQERYPALHATIVAGETRKEVLAICRRVLKMADAETLDCLFSDGAFSAFKAARLAQVTPEYVSTRSAADERADRILNIRDSSGRRTARKMS
jgi:hypothetical protein